MADTVIYYPAVSPPLPWLKRAALMWDKVYRIVVPDVALDPPEVEIFCNALGDFLGNIDPTKSQNEEHVLSDLLMWADKFGAKINSEDEEFREVTLYSRKISRRVVQELVNRGIARTIQRSKTVILTTWEIKEREQRMMETTQRYEPHEPNSDAAKFHNIRNKIWDLEKRKDSYSNAKLIDIEIEKLRKENENIRLRNLEEYHESVDLLAVPAKFAEHFFSLVAANHRSADIYRSSEKSDIFASEAIYSDTATLRSRMVHGHAGTAIIEHFIPGDLELLSAESVAALRTELMLARLKFQIDVQALIHDLESVSSEADLDRFKQRAVALAQEKVDAAKAIYTKEKLDTVLAGAAVTLTPPALAGMIASALGVGISAPISISAALGLFAADRWLSWREAGQRYSDSSWSYLTGIANASKQ